VLVAMTVLVVLATANAVNFIDGLDGLAVGVVAIAALAFFIYSYYVSRSYNPPNVFSNATFICAAVLGCCVGFLPHNFHPARLFMGDSGALLLGLLLSAATISLSGSVDPGAANGGSLIAALLPLAVPLAVLSLPFLDMVLAVLRRTLAGKNPWDADRKHLHHRMLELGHGHRNAVLLLYMWAALLALGTVSFAFVESWRAAIVIGVCLAVAVTLTVWLPRWTGPKRL
jgi:UDP-GlcNAc:undecaprenyl-phosphate GlcNAc-1-phosphate transferase